MDYRKDLMRRMTKARRAEIQYSQRLRSVAKHIQQLLVGFNPDGSYSNSLRIKAALDAYSNLLEPWANSVAGVMLEDVARRDKSMWMEHSQDIGKALRDEILRAPTGHLFRELQVAQAVLITSLPKEAGQRVVDLATGNLHEGIRAADLVKEILRTGDVTEARARTIARTETSRAASNLLQARSMYVGSEGYVWRTSKDFDVRPSHQKMNGKFVAWASPPTLDKLTGHAGCLPNCRCWADPVLPD